MGHAPAVMGGVFVELNFPHLWPTWRGVRLTNNRLKADGNGPKIPRGQS